MNHTESLLDRYFEGFEGAQRRLRDAISSAIRSRGLSDEKLADIASISTDKLRAVRCGDDFVDQDVLENLAFPLELMPNAILRVTLDDMDYQEWRSRLADYPRGLGGGGPTRRTPPSGPSRAECETYIVLKALADSDEVIASRKSSKEGDGDR